MNELPGVVNSGLARTAERDAVMGLHYRRQAQMRRAVALGAAHGRAGTTPYGDLGLDDSRLMTALGETELTTEDNHPRRLALVQAYRDAYDAAREG